jgi:hypothetical protein
MLGKLLICKGLLQDLGENCKWLDRELLGEFMAIKGVTAKTSPNEFFTSKMAL